MIDYNDFSGIGEQIKSAVQGAIESMDFNQLNRTVSDTVTQALNEAKAQLRQASDLKSTPVSREENKTVPVKKDLPAIKKAPASVGGILCTVFGAIGTGVCTTVIVTLLVIGMFLPQVLTLGAIIPIILLVPLLAVFAVLLGKGNSIRGRIKRFNAYVREINGALYYSIKDLSQHIHKSNRFVVKDLRAMIEKGMLPNAHIDEQETCIMLEDGVYQQYLIAQESMKNREAEIKREKRVWRWRWRSEDISQNESAREISEEEQAREETETKHTQVDAMLEEGKTYLQILRKANAAIPGEEISAKLYKLETVIDKIFESVKRHPEQVKEMQKFMEYYLPTTVKLVSTYRDFDAVDIQGENIRTAKKEIEQTLDTINKAFECLLDDLYQDAALDASTDATVLQAMLAKDGFTDSDFRREDKL